MRVLQIITSLMIGGAEHLVVQITQILRNQGYEVDVCLLDGEETALYRELESSGCVIYSLSKKRCFYNPEFILKLRRIMKGYDVIHTHNSSPQLFAAIANVGLKKRLVTTEHNTDNRKRKNPLLRVIDRWMYERYEKIICISPKTEERLRIYLNNNKSSFRLITISNGINVASFQKAQVAYDIRPANKFVVTMVGAFRAQKDHKTLIDAMNHLPRDKFQLWLIGDGDLRDKMQDYANRTLQKKDIIFWGNRADIPQMLKASDIVVLSSHWEGFGLAAVEGMAAGKPVIASDVDGLREVVKDAGLLFHPGDVDELASLIMHLSKDASFYEQTAMQCRKRAFNYDISKMIEGYKNVYEQK